MLKKLASETLIYGGSDFVTKLIAFAAFPVIAHALGSKGFGALELVLTSITMLGLFVNCGQNNAVQRFYWDNDTAETAHRALVSTGMGVLLFNWALVAVLVACIAPYIIARAAEAEVHIGALTIWGGVGLLFAMQMTQYTQDTIRLHFNPKGFFFFTLLSKSLAMLSVVLLVLFYQHDIGSIVAIQAIVMLAALPVGLFIIRKDIGFSFDMGWAKTLLSFGYPFIFAGLAYWVFGYMDRWMVAEMLSVADAGQYAIAARLSMIILFVSTAFGQAWSPYAIKIRRDFPDTYRQIYADVFVILLAFMVVCAAGMAFFAADIILLLLGEGYAAAIPCLMILAFSIVPQASLQVTAIGLSLERKSAIMAQLAWVAALVNFGANILFIGWFGIQGAALATLLAYLVLTGGYFFYTQKLHALPFHMPKIVGISMLSAVLLAASLYGLAAPSSLLIAGGKVAALLSVAAGLVWLVNAQQVGARLFR